MSSVFKNIIIFPPQCKKNLEAAKEEYDRQHKELMEAMPSFFEGRVEYFQPCFEALIKSQVLLCLILLFQSVFLLSKKQLGKKKRQINYSGT